MSKKGKDEDAVKSFFGTPDPPSTEETAVEVEGHEVTSEIAGTGEGEQLGGFIETPEAEELPVVEKQKRSPMSDEARQRLAEKMRGRHHTEETKQKLREKMKEKFQDEGLRKKIGEGIRKAHELKKSLAA